MALTSGATRAIGVAGFVAILAGAAGTLLFHEEEARPVVARPAVVKVAPAREPREPSLAPPSAITSGAPASVALVGSSATPAAVASDTWAALPSSLDDEAPDADEVTARGLLGAQLVAWLAEEDDADAALLWAEQVGDLARWLKDDDRARLLSIARDDPLEARRRAALVALGRVAAAEPGQDERLADAFARGWLEQAIAGLRAAGVVLRD